MNIRIRAVCLSLLASLLVMPSWAANMDSKSQELADASVDAMGGREAYLRQPPLSLLAVFRSYFPQTECSGFEGIRSRIAKMVIISNERHS